jgi:hypothetical protein
MASHMASVTAEEKDPAAESTPIDSDIEHGHLKDLGVDIGQILDEGRQHNIEDNTSPYPEGALMSFSFPQYLGFVF